MSAIRAPQRYTKADSEVINVAVDVRGLLDDGELATGTPTIVEVTTSDLTIANKAVSSTALTILGESVAAGEAIQCKVSGGTANTSYTIRITFGTDSDPAQTRIVDILIDVVD